MFCGVFNFEDGDLDLRRTVTGHGRRLLDGADGQRLQFKISRFQGHEGLSRGKRDSTCCSEFKCNLRAEAREVLLVPTQTACIVASRKLNIDLCYRFFILCDSLDGINYSVGILAS